jgi:glutaredoxin 3
MKVQLVSKPDCPYCDQAKGFLGDLGLEYGVEMLDPSASTYESRKRELVETTGGRTFPFIFIEGEYIGGFRELVAAYDTGRLAERCRLYGITLPEIDF